MKSHSIAEYKAAGCSLMNSPNRGMLEAAHELVGGKLCDTGCADFNGGKCSAYRLLQAGSEANTSHAAPSAPVETVREEAARLGVSLAEVRRRRAAA